MPSSVSTSSRARRNTRPRLLSSTRPSRPSLTHTHSRLHVHDSSTSADSEHANAQQTARPKIRKLKGAPLIRNYHVKLKRLAQLQHPSAKPTPDTAVQITQLQSELDSLGGMPAYQAASVRGQKSGGDTSIILLEWLTSLSRDDPETPRWKEGLRILEVGAVDANNALGKRWDSCTSHTRKSKQTACPFPFDISRLERIDLHTLSAGESTAPARIKQEDFMQRPLPSKQEDTFDLISLSLVLNFVGDAAGRGEMLKRVQHFLRVEEGGARPLLFIVLPAPCVANSRYLTEERLEAMMTWLGYVLVRRKLSARLIYCLWRFHAAWIPPAEAERGLAEFKKVEIRPGGAINNFCIVVQ